MNRLGLRAKFVIHSVWLLTGLGLAVTFYSVSQLRDLLFQEMVRRVEAQSLNWIEANTLQILLSGDAQTLQHLAQQLKQRQAIAYVELLGAAGISKAAVSLPRSLAKIRDLPPGTDPCMRWREMRDQAGNRYFELAACIQSSGTGMSPDLGALFGAVAPVPTIGELRVGVNRREFDRGLRALVLKNFGLAGLLILIAIALSLIFAHRMVNPIASMAKAANQIAAGNLSERVVPGAGLQDEIGDLVRNFNRMAARLEANREQMSLLNWQLEEKVRERTRQLESANSKLREIDRRKSEFLSTVSHELRTPLTSIKAYSEILLDSPAIEPETRARFLSIIDAEAGRMSRLITDLLNLEKLESGMRRWNMSLFDLRQIVRTAGDVLAPALAEKSVRLAFAMPEAQIVLADADRIQEVFTNLLGNAVKFCEQGGRIQVALKRVPASGPRGHSGDYVQVEVTDDGPGIPCGERDQVFEMFYQGVNCAGRPGAGLGLAIARAIVLHHQGEIWLDCKRRQGAVFCFTLPRYSAAPEISPPLQHSWRTA